MQKIKHIGIGILSGILQYCILAVSSYWVLTLTADNVQLSPWVYVAICFLIGITVLCYLWSTDTLLSLFMRILWNFTGFVGIWLIVQSPLEAHLQLSTSASTDLFMYECIHMLWVVLTAVITIITKFVVILVEKYP